MPTGNREASINNVSGINQRSIAKSSFMQESLKESFMDGSGVALPFEAVLQDQSKLTFAELCREEQTSMLAAPQMDVSGPAFASMQSFVKANSNDTYAPVLEESLQASETEQSTLQHDVLQPSKDLSISMSNLNLDGLEAVSDPFDEKLRTMFLSKLSLPIFNRHGYVRIDSNVPQIRSNRAVQIGDNVFLVGQCKGEGSYGKVYKAMKSNPDSLDETIANMDVVLKVQKPACEWEFYICTEIHRRLGSNDAGSCHDWFMSIPRCFTYNDGNVFVSEHHQGTLLDFINNNMKRVNSLAFESVAMYFVIELLIIFERLKSLEIIHGDVKPDNFLIQRQ